jgi:hypothetical protein
LAGGTLARDCRSTPRFHHPLAHTPLFYWGSGPEPAVELALVGDVNFPIRKDLIHVKEAPKRGSYKQGAQDH